MKFGVVILGLGAMMGVSGAALAQQAPPARVGFQMALRTGYAIPTGDAVKDVKLSDRVSGQVPIILDIGGKVIPQLFIGGYFGLGFGGVTGTNKSNCELTNQACVAVALNLGFEAQYHILPAGTVNPWLGYGIGLESLAFSVATPNDSTQTASLAGFNFARFSGGVDFRINRGFGVGPFVEYSIAKYTSANDGSRDIDIKDISATHGWLTLGARFVFFP